MSGGRFGVMFRMDLARGSPECKALPLSGCGVERLRG
jgi:hypothetical protein